MLIMLEAGGKRILERVTLLVFTNNNERLVDNLSRLSP